MHRNLLQQRTTARILRIALAVLLLTLPGRADLPAGWSDANISTSTGSSTCANGVYTLTGTGKGISQDGDQIHFTYRTVPTGGNFRFIAHLAAFDGAAGSQVGLTVRQSLDPKSTMAAVSFQPHAGSGSGPQVFTAFARDIQPGAKYPWRNNGLNSAMSPPCWLQLFRHGQDFAVYKSTDGKFWAQVHNASGGPFTVSGPIEIGFLVSGGTASATATFDHVQLDLAPVLAYESSWIGNSFSSDSEGFVSGGTTAMWVDPDGSCYTTSSWDEGGEPGKKYRDGKVITPFTLTPGHGYEGAITSDGTHLYYFSSPAQNYNRLYQTDLSGSFDSARPLFVDTPLIDPKGGMLKLSGLAAANGELYVSDALTSQILVVNLAQKFYGLPSNAINQKTDHAIDLAGVDHPAPPEIYQTSFLCDYISFAIPGLDPHGTYNVRLHFAETNPDDAAVGKRLMNLSAGGKNLDHFDIYATAGALNKAVVATIAGATPDGTGQLGIGIGKAPGTSDAWVTISGVEIVSADGASRFLLNCGGPAVGEWKSTIYEIPSRAFPFTRPGPISADKNGNLWIVQEGATFPASGNFHATPGWAAIKLYDKNGNFLNRQITDLVNPTATFYDSAKDQLLVAENGPAQNIRIYDLHTGTETPPALAGEFGIRGGVFSGKTPGVIHDRDAGGDARFLGPTGVGVDVHGNIYVACNPGFSANQTDLRAFSPDGKLLWSLFGLEMTHTGDFDSTRGDSDVWTSIHHYAMDYHGTTAGGEWKLKSYLTNPFAPYTFPSNTGGGSCVYREIMGKPILYTSGQGVIDSIYFYRFAGEQIIPCGSLKNDINGTALWLDSNGDGIQQDSELKIVPDGGFRSFDVDKNGNIYLAMGDVGGTRPRIEKFACQGFDSHGSPLYATAHFDYPTPAAFNQPDTGNVRRLRYLGGPRDTMYLLGETKPFARKTDFNYGATLGCYDHWSTQPVARFVTPLPDPSVDYNVLSGPPPYSMDGFVYEAFDAANGYAFVTDLWGTIAVIDSTGKHVTNILPGPEISGGNAWEDENMGLRVHYNSGRVEYDILQENSGFRARQNFYRWKPSP